MLDVSKAASAAVNAAQAQQNPFAWVGTTELLTSELGPFPWVIEGLQIGPGRPCGLFGYGGGGKSYVAQAIAICIASARPFLERWPLRAGKVRHVSHEMGLRTLKERYRRLASGMCVPLDEFGERLEVSAYPRVYLNSGEAEKAYVQAAEGHVLIIVDSLRRALPGEDENDSAISNYLDLLGRVSDETGCAFLVLHHSGKSALADDQSDEKRGAGRGSSAIEDGCSCIWSVEGGGIGLRRMLHMRAHESAGKILDPFWIDMPDMGTSFGPLYPSSQAPTKVKVLSDDEVKRKRQQAKVKKNLQIEEDAADAILETVKSQGTLSLRKILKSVGDSRKNRSLVRELLDEGRLVETITGLEASEPKPTTSVGGM